jgi:hypothetical protein
VNDSPLPAPRPDLDAQRERTVRALCEHFARDHIADGELERRLDATHRATAVQQLHELVADLPALSGQAAAPARAPQGAGAQAPRNAQMVVAIFGGTERRGVWTPARQVTAIAVMGGAVLDFREARLPPGVTDVQCFAFWGGIDILVSPDIHVETGGLAIMGGFEQDGEASGVPPKSDAPILRIGGLALMGGVDVRIRYPGESARDARLRRKEERKRLKGMS